MTSHLNLIRIARKADFLAGNSVLNSVERTVARKRVGHRGLTALKDNVLSPIADENMGLFNLRTKNHAAALRWQAWFRLAELESYPKRIAPRLRHTQFLLGPEKEIIDGRSLGFRDAALFSSREKRQLNQDAALLARKNNDSLAAVADGLGGHPLGEVASAVAIETLAGVFASPAAYGLNEFVPADAFRCAAMSLFGEPDLHLKRLDDPLFAPGTTLTSAFIRGDQATITHVGDSRAYLFREGRLSVLTPDDGGLLSEIKKVNDYGKGVKGAWLKMLCPSFVIFSMAGLAEEPFIAWIIKNNRLPDFPLSGEMAASYTFLASQFRSAYILDKHLGMPIISTPYGYHFQVQPGDLLLLATDGLNKLEFEQLTSVLDNNQNGSTAELLLKLYNFGPKFSDNLTIAAIKL
ncbi:MAG: protein phosphatase 2C domain-containing protein [Candidatus Margulisiibacteriota bacterium]